MAIDALQRLAESIADGSTIDWDTVRLDPGVDQGLIGQLRIVAELAALHRSLPLEPADWPSVSLARRASPSPAIGNWGHLILLERLAGGTFGDVYSAWDPHLEREVALKLLRIEHSGADLHTSQIVREGRLLARVRHPNVITVFGVSQQDNRIGLWMEWIRGVTLEQLLQTHGPLGAGEATSIGIDLCRALAAIHAAGLIHRDIKAQNAMREAGGRLVLMDFGAGREIDGGAGRHHEGSDLTGTPLYLAPEILTGESAGVRSDIYSLGVLLYHLVTRSFPVPAATIDELYEAHAQGKAVLLRDARADLPTAFVRVVDRAIAHAPERRYPSAGALEADLVALGQSSPSAVPEAPTNGSVPPNPRVWKSVGALGAGVIVILMAALFGAMDRGGWGGGTTGGPIHSVAVLPLVNLSGDSTQEYFADGMTDELIATLGRLDGLNVISRTSVMQFKGSKASLSEIARTLGVDAVLEGSVLAVPGGTEPSNKSKKIRINARLIEASTNRSLWNKTFETIAVDVLALQSEVSKAVSREIGGHLTNAVAVPSMREQDFDAFDLYLRGRAYWNLRTVDGLKRGVQYFQQAVDRGYGPAYAGLADSYNLMGVYGMLSREEAASLAIATASQALAIDESLAEAYASLGLAQMGRFEWHSAEANFKRAIALRPGYASGHQWYADYLSQQGRLSEALVEVRRAAELDPLSSVINSDFGLILTLARRYDDAIQQFEKTLQRDPRFARARVNLAEAYILKGEYDRALRQLSAAGSFLPDDVGRRADLGYVFAAIGRRVEALDIANELAERFRDGDDAAAGGVAVVYTGLGDNNRTFEWLDRASELHDPWIAYARVEPRFDGLRNDSRFVQLLARMRLVQ